MSTNSVHPSQEEIPKPENIEISNDKKLQELNALNLYKAQLEDDDRHEKERKKSVDEKIQITDDEEIKELEIFNMYYKLFVNPNMKETKKGNSKTLNCYDVFNSLDDPVFKVVQKFEHDSEYLATVFDIKTGNEILKLKAQSEQNDYVNVYTRHNNLKYYQIGKILRHHDLPGGPNYNILRANDKVAMKINRPTETQNSFADSGFGVIKNTYFNICSLENMEAIEGQIIAKSIINRFPEGDNENLEYETYEISFTADATITSKALALATTLFMDFDYFKNKPKWKCTKQSAVVIAAAFFMILIIATIPIYFVVFKGQQTALDFPRIDSNSESNSQAKI